MLRPAVAAMNRDKAGKSVFGIGRQRLSVKKGFENGREPQSARAGAGRQRRRVTAVGGILLNLVLIATAIPAHNYLVIVVQFVVLVLNSYRLHQMLQLIRDVRKSVNSDLSMDWLKPFMTEHKWKTGEILFYKDEKAEDM